MRLNIRNRTEKSTLTFNALVREAVDVTKRLDALNNAGGVLLSADAFFRETLASVQGNPKRVAELRAAMEKGAIGRNAEGALRHMIAQLRAGRVPRPAKDPKRLSRLTTEAATGELARPGFSTVELFALAVQMAGETYPELFGSEDSSAQIENELSTLQERQAHLFAQIPRALTADDLHIGPLDAQGRANVTFKLSDGNVSIAPAENSGERLVRYLIAHPRTS